MTRTVIENVLAQRYASEPMREIWSERGKIVAERRFWVAIMRAQQAAGYDISDEVIAAYEAVVEDVHLDSIEMRERQTKHDVKARIDEFDALAGGHGKIHLGMTSRDLTENIEQWQVRAALRIVRFKVIAALDRLNRLSLQYAPLVMAGRSHNVAGEPTTLGKRFATWSEELLVAFDALEDVLANIPLRGIKGPMGTNEGDVSCSVVRRVVLADSFFAIDGLLESFLTVLDEFGAYPRMIEAELERYLPFLVTTAILRLAMDAGISREVAHEAIKECAVAVAQQVRDGVTKASDLYDRLAAHPQLSQLAIEDVRLAVANPMQFVGGAVAQVAQVAARVNTLLNAEPEAAKYQPGDIL